MSLVYNEPGTGNPGDMIYADTQIEWDGLLMGVDTFFGYKKLIGWDDMPGVDSSDAPRPHAHGDFPGAMFAQSRIVTLDTQIWTQPNEFPELRREFMKRFQITQVEKPLVIRQHGVTELAWGRVVGRSWPIDKQFFGGYPVASVQWLCSDPRKYSVTEGSLHLDAPSSSGGLPWDTFLDWDTGLSWGTSVSGSGNVFNDGVADSPLRIEFHGPLTPPYFVYSPGNWIVGFTLPLAAGETLISDARTGTVTLGGIDRYYALSLESDLPEDALALPGSNPVQFVPGAPGDLGNVDIYWRHASM